MWNEKNIDIREQYPLFPKYDTEEIASILNIKHPGYNGFNIIMTTDFLITTTNGLIEIIEAECCRDHVHMLVRIPPKFSVAEIMGYLKGKSSLMIFERHANLKYKYGNRHFWCRGYYVDTVGKNQKKIEEYIKNQLHEDFQADQLSLFEPVDPFTGKTLPTNKKNPRKPL